MRTGLKDVGGILYADRQLVLAYPRAGNDLDLILDASGIREVAGNVLGVSVAEDATTLASQSWAIGGSPSGSDVPVHGIAQNDTLVTDYGYPYLQNSRSYTSVIEQPTIDGHAQSLLALSQSSEIPGSLTLVLEGATGMDSFGLGDRFTLAIGESINFPTGDELRVRVLGWTLKPPAEGPELLDLQIARE
jgi:hypothetical protein